MNSFQSAYTKFNSTETTLLAVHDHIIRAMSQQQVTGLCLLDLSAAFDTTDHSILLHCLKILVWIHWNCLFLDSLLPFISVLLCWYQWHQISSLSTSLWCSSRFCSWPSSLHSLYNSTQHNNFSIICQPQTQCRWHSTFPIIFSRCFLRKNSTLTKYNLWNFFMDGF